MNVSIHRLLNNSILSFPTAWSACLVFLLKWFIPRIPPRLLILQSIYFYTKKSG